MALRIDAEADNFRRSTDMPGQSAWAMFMRVKLRGTGGSGNDQIFASYASGYASYLRLGVNQSSRYLYAYESGGGFGQISTAMSADVWYDVAFRQSGSAGTLHMAPTGGAAFSTASITVSSWTQIGMCCGVPFTDSSQYCDAVFDDLRIWSAGLTTAELERERTRRAPIRMADLHAWLPLIAADKAASLSDYSGSGRDFTEGGAITVEDGAPVSWGAPIIVPEYATVVAPVLSLPGVQNITASSATPKVTLTF